MSDATPTSFRPAAGIPADDPQRKLTVTALDTAGLRCISVAGDTCTILVTGAETAGRYCLIDMLVPSGGGPPPHRHDFEEMFTLLEGELQFTFRGEKSIVRAGSTVNVPANAPHSFVNASASTARMLCLCAPAGLEEFFMEVGDPVGSRTALAPDPSREEAAERAKKVQALAAKYRIEIVGP